MRHIAVLAVAAAIGWTFNALAQDAEALLKKEGCMKCHSVSAKKEGPAFKDVAAKYKGKPDGAAAVQKQITAAKDHPHVKTKNEKDVKAMVDYVLSR
jgi:cytochrome c